MKTVEELREWLIEGTPGAPNPVALLDRLLPGLVEAGVAIDKSEAFVRTLHPHIAGRSFFWERGKKVEVRERTFAYLSSPEFMDGPVGRVFRTGEPVRLEKYIALPLRFTSGESHAITFQTSDRFSDEDYAALLRILAPLSRMGEIFALSRTAVNLLSTYVGRGAGGRILSGQIQKGDTETICCAIWFSDLRGFTSLASKIDPATLIRLLNDLFECQVPSIEKHGGEVLKFMGDGLLGIFPIGASRAEQDACEAALAAYEGSCAALEERNRNADVALEFGLALHVGEVSFGNIGGSSRLDFTCIGPAVNVAARIEGLTGKLGAPVLMSSAFVKNVKRRVIEAGTYELKGVPEPQQVFRLPLGS